MTALQRWALHLTTALVTASGIAYFWMKYGIRGSDPFSVINHPWQPFALKLHILSAPFLILVFGIVLQSHVARKLQNGDQPNRVSGLVSIASFGLMILSGYWLQVAASQGMLRAALIVHMGSSLVFAAAYLVHLVVSIRLERRVEEHEDAAVASS